jgi:hypothetical protein
MSTADGSVMPGMEELLNRQDESTIIDPIVRRSVLRVTRRRHGSTRMLHLAQDLTFSEKESRL